MSNPKSRAIKPARAAIAVPNTFPPDSDIQPIPEHQFQKWRRAIEEGLLPTNELDYVLERIEADHGRATGKRKANAEARNHVECASASSREQAICGMNWVFTPLGARERHGSIKGVNETNKKKRQVADANKADIHRLADDLLSKEKSITTAVIRHMAGRIQIKLDIERGKQKKKALNRRTISSHLKTHSSGYWKKTEIR